VPRCRDGDGKTRAGATAGPSRDAAALHERAGVKAALSLCRGSAGETGGGGATLPRRRTAAWRQCRH